MKAFNRDTRAKLSHNPTGELLKVLIPCIKNKIAGQLRAICAASCLAFLLSCTPEPISVEACPDGCNAEIIFPVQPDINGYYHIKLDWTGEYLPWFSVNVEASVVDDIYRYNGVAVAEARFDSDTSWVLGEGLVIQQPLYTPFGDYTTNWLPIPTSWVDINLPQYAGEEINIAQGTGLRFSEKNGKLHTKRILGPFPPSMVGDTITVYMRVLWDAGENYVVKDHYSQKFIVE